MKITVTTDDGQVHGVYNKVRVVREGRWYTVYSGDDDLLSARTNTDDELVRDLILYAKREE